MIEDLASPLTIRSLLPAMLQGDDFAQRFTAGLDTQLAPIQSTLDNIDAYTDPWIAPDDFLEWLAGWFGWELDRNWPERRRRAVVARAVELYRWRGTVRGLALMIELYTGLVPEIDDGGGTWATLDPSEGLPGTAREAIGVRLVAGEEDIDEKRLRRLLRSIIPAHLRLELEIIGRESDGDQNAPVGEGPADDAS